MQHNGRRNNNNRNRFKNNNNNNRRRYNNGCGGSSSGFDDESSNISVQQRKNFANKYEQYVQKAKDALRSGDRVDAENHYQHADHAYRMMNLGLTGGLRFDAARMIISNPNQQSNADYQENSEGGEQVDNSPMQVEGSSDQAPASDIAALPFMQPIETNDRDPRIIE